MKVEIKKFIKFGFTFVSLFILLSFGQSVFAQQEVTSPSFRIITPSLNAGGGAGESSSFYIYESLGDISDPKLTSTSYAIGSGTPNTFIANVPLVSCFETNTDSGTSLCNSSYPNNDGTKGEAGEGGFYDRAKFVIDTQGNPSDALYGVQISTDNFATIQYVDGTTRMVVSAKSISNYLTKSDWESSPWNSANIIGLSPNTEYKIRITALNGDLTESSPGPEATVSTTVPSITFDLDIDDSTWPNSTETAAPYSVSLGTLSVSGVTTAASRIYMDAGTNAINGISIDVADLSNGLLSTSTSTTIPSPTTGNPLNTDLDSALEGFGIRVSNVNTSNPTSLVRDGNYYNAGLPEQVGRVKSIGSDVIMTSPGGVFAGRAQVEVKAKVSSTTPAAEDYSDILTFTSIGNF